MPTEAEPFTAEEIAERKGAVEHDCAELTCHRIGARVIAERDLHDRERRWLATLDVRDARIAELEGENAALRNQQRADTRVINALEHVASRSWDL